MSKWYEVDSNTSAMPIPGAGVVLQYQDSTDLYDGEGVREQSSYSVSMVFIPGVHLVQDKDKSWSLFGASPIRRAGETLPLHEGPDVEK